MRGTAAKPAGRPGGAPVRVDTQRLAALLGPVVADTGMDLESVHVSRAGRRLLVRVVVDSDSGVSLDDAADVSREVSAKLDATDVMGEQPYTLEVSSPGVDRPLTEPKHWRRATGRLVNVPLLGDDGQPSGERLSGRVVAADGDTVTVETNGQPSSYGYAALGAGSIELEFGGFRGTDSSDEQSGRLESADETDE